MTSPVAVAVKRMPRFEWKLDATAVLTVVFALVTLAVTWGMFSSRLSAMEAQMLQVSSSTQQLTTAVVKLQTQLEERERREDRRR